MRIIYKSVSTFGRFGILGFRCIGGGCGTLSAKPNTTNIKSHSHHYLPLVGVLDLSCSAAPICAAKSFTGKSTINCVLLTPPLFTVVSVDSFDLSSDPVGYC